MKIDKTSKEKYEELKYHFRNKGYGDRNEELSFFKEYFSHFFEMQFDVFQVEWQQYQDYNDNWYYYDINELKVNQYLDIHFECFDDKDEKDWKYGFHKAGFEDEKSDDSSKFYSKLEKENNHLRNQIDKVFIFLRALYDYYGGYYFIYVFGSRAKITISKEGIIIDNENIE